MRTSAENDDQAPADEEDDFRLSDALTLRTDEEIEQIAEAQAEADVTSSAYEGIPLDKATLKAGLIASYKQMRAARAARQQPVKSLA